MAVPGAGAQRPVGLAESAAVPAGDWLLVARPRACPWRGFGGRWSGGSSGLSPGRSAAALPRRTRRTLNPACSGRLGCVAFPAVLVSRGERGLLGLAGDETHPAWSGQSLAELQTLDGSALSGAERASQPSVYSETSPIAVSGAYSQVNVHRIVALDCKLLLQSYALLTG